jgi:uncharacterized membrane protein (DUF373 family)
LNASSVGGRLLVKFELTVIVLLQFLLVVVVAVATANLFKLFFTRIPATWGEVQRADELLPVMQRAFGGILVVVLGLELIETLKTYFHEHRVRLEVILIVSIIAVGRHIIQVDFSHMAGSELIGMGVLMLSLTGGFFLVTKTHGQKKTD